MKSAVCARLAATIAVMPTTEPDDRSMPPMMMTCVTPTAMMPISASCRIMILQAQRIEDEGLAYEHPAQRLEQQHHADHDAEDAELRRQTAAAADAALRRRDGGAGCRWPRS